MEDQWHRRIALLPNTNKARAIVREFGIVNTVTAFNRKMKIGRGEPDRFHFYIELVFRNSFKRSFEFSVLRSRNVQRHKKLRTSGIELPLPVADDGWWLCCDRW